MRCPTAGVYESERYIPVAYRLAPRLTSMNSNPVILPHRTVGSRALVKLLLIQWLSTYRCIVRPMSTFSAINNHHSNATQRRAIAYYITETCCGTSVSIRHITQGLHTCDGRVISLVTLKNLSTCGPEECTSLCLLLTADHWQCRSAVQYTS